MSYVVGCTAPPHLSPDRVVISASIPATGGGAVLWDGLLKTEGQPDRAVAVRRILCSGAAAVARRVAALLVCHHRHRHVRVVGLRCQ